MRYILDVNGYVDVNDFVAELAWHVVVEADNVAHAYSLFFGVDYFFGTDVGIDLLKQTNVTVGFVKNVRLISICEASETAQVDDLSKPIYAKSLVMR